MKKKSITTATRLSVSLCWVILCLAAFVHHAYAANDEGANMGGSGGGQIAPQPCDPKYWETMSARAWMEAEREIMQNQNLIFKPDSVLEYTCFDKAVTHGGKYLGDVFVHTDYFGKVIIVRDTAQAQEVALKNVVSSALAQYLNGSFANEFLAKRSTAIRQPPGQIDNDEVKLPTKDGPAYTCDIMAKVWKASKCMNFIDRRDYTKKEDPHTETIVYSDSFRPFLTLAPGPGGGDPVEGYDAAPDIRMWPEECDNLKAEEWKAKDDVATNKDDKQYDFREPLKKDFEDVRKMIEPGQCGTALETGVTVILSGTTSSNKPDKVCTNPGCTYNGDSGKCE
jgi:hypothetical protein